MLSFKSQPKLKHMYYDPIDLTKLQTTTKKHNANYFLLQDPIQDHLAAYGMFVQQIAFDTDNGIQTLTIKLPTMMSHRFEDNLCKFEILSYKPFILDDKYSSELLNDKIIINHHVSICSTTEMVCAVFLGASDIPTCKRLSFDEQCKKCTIEGIDAYTKKLQSQKWYTIDAFDEVL